MRILGIDPGIATVGFGVVDSEGPRQSFVRCGVITTPAGTALSSRLERIYSDMGELISTFKPDAAAVEELFFNTNITTGINVAHARGVLLLAAIHHCGNLYEYTPLQIKQAMTGYGKATKKQIQEMVKTYLSLAAVPKPDDAADALAVALTHAQTGGFTEKFYIR